MNMNDFDYRFRVYASSLKLDSNKDEIIPYGYVYLITTKSDGLTS